MGRVDAIDAWSRKLGDTALPKIGDRRIEQNGNSINRISLECLMTPDRAPDALWGRRHFDVTDAERGEGVDQRVADGRQGADIAGFAGALDAQRVRFGRHRVVFALDRRKVTRAWHCVI